MFSSDAVELQGLEVMSLELPLGPLVPRQAFVLLLHLCQQRLVISSARVYPLPGEVVLSPCS